MDEAVICVGCGCPIEQSNTEMKESEKKEKKKISSKKKIVLIVLSCVLALAIVAGVLAALILPRPNLALKDFKETSYIGAIFQFGIPTSPKEEDEDYLRYRNCIEFYGVTADVFMVYYEENKYSMLFSEDEYLEALVDTIKSKCDLEDINNSLASGGIRLSEYSYGDRKISVSEYYDVNGTVTDDNISELYSVIVTIKK